MRLRNTGILVQIAFALLLALIAAPIVRTVTSELNHTMGRVWPFSMARCHSPSTPGCIGQEPEFAMTLPVTRGGAGPL